MGNSKSSQYDSLIEKCEPSQWLILDDRQTHQLWQSTLNHKRFMAYLMDYSQINTEDKLQLYHFRKLNHANIVTIHSIVTNDSQFLCSHPKNCSILIENIPLRLASFRKSFSFQQGLTILSSVFSGYNTINYIFGPLYTNEDMIGFTELGVTKVWINQNFAINQPSKQAKIDSTDLFDRKVGQQNLEMEMYKCVRKAINIVQESVVGGFPYEFKRQIASVRTFVGGEQFIENYSKSRGIQLSETVPLEKVNRVEPLRLNNRSIISESISYQIQNSNRTLTNHNEPMKTENSTNYIRTENTSNVPRSVPLQSQMLLLSSRLIKGNSKINITFNHQSPCGSVVLNQKSKVISHKRVASLGNNFVFKDQKQEAYTINKNYLSQALRSEVNAVESLQQIRSHPHQQRQQLQQEKQKVRTVKEVNDQTENQQEESDHQIKRLKTIESKQQLQLQSLGQSSHFSADEIQKWEESLLKLSDRQKCKLQKINQPTINYKSANQSQEDHYLSKKMDKVEYRQQQARYTNQTQVQAYIRNKYKDYFQSERPSEEMIPKYDNYQDNIKYTFGKIEIEPSLAFHQHKKAEIKIQSESFRQSKRRSTRLSIGNNLVKRCSIDERYLKYVINKQPGNLISSKILSSIQKVDDSFRKDNKRQYSQALNTVKNNQNQWNFDYQQISITKNKQTFKNNNYSKKSNHLHQKSLTYDKLRDFLRN